MVNKRSSSPTLEGTSGNDDADTFTEKYAAMGELHRHNQTLEDDIHNIKIFQHDFSPLEEM